MSNYGIDGLCDKAHDEKVKLEHLEHDLKMAVHNMDTVLWSIEHRKLRPEKLDKFKKYLEQIETVGTKVLEVLEVLEGLHVKMEEEYESPHCASCGEYEEVRTGVDTEGRHECLGE